MKTVNVQIKLYHFDELSADARTIALEDHRYFLLSDMCPSDFISGDDEHDTEENLQDIYETEYKNIERNDDPVIESIEANEYYFYEDGELANTVTYTGNHPKVGTTEFTFNNKKYII